MAKFLTRYQDTEQAQSSEAASVDSDSIIVNSLGEPDEAAALDSEQIGAKGSSLFVAIFSARENWYRRHYLRRAMVNGRRAAPNFFTARFVLCQQDGARSNAVQAEAHRFGDILLLDCEEGVTRTLLTRKLVATLNVYNASFLQNHSHFMRVDDDTFVSWRRLQRLIDETARSDFSYMGASVAAGRPVNRDANSLWYQPEDEYSAKVYPLYMMKGHGYILSRSLVKVILSEDVAKANMLSNEDQAVGVWVEEVRQNGIKVDIVEIPAGEGPWQADANTTWGTYPLVLHHLLKGDSIHCLAEVEAIDKLEQRVADCFVDSMFVAVFSARRNAEKREHIRRTIPFAEGESHRATVKFVLCEEQDDSSASVAAEVQAHGDIMLLPCKEGYARTLLTAKLVATMETYVKDFGDKALLMKVDDDTFVSWTRLRRFVAEQQRPERVYMGILGPAGVKVNRDATSLWYQPRDVYPAETYPKAMEGGPGYILGGEIVRRLLALDIPEKNLLANEDQAMGVWVDLMRQQGWSSNMVSVPGTDGYRPEFDTCHGSWGEYPFYLHHNLQPSTISCLAGIEQSYDSTRLVDGCFPDCFKLTATALNTKISDISVEVQGAMRQLKTLEGELEGIMKGVQWMAQQAAGNQGSS